MDGIANRYAVHLELAGEGLRRDPIPAAFSGHADMVFREGGAQGHLQGHLHPAQESWVSLENGSIRALQDDLSPLQGIPVPPCSGVLALP